jgi:phosphoglycerate dehydrogenase-like enzyme
MMKKKAAFFTERGNDVIDYVYAMGRRDEVAELVDLYPEIITSQNLEQHLDNLADIEVIFSTWGMLNLSDAVLDKLPKLKAVFYGAGATDGFARQLLKRDIVVVSAWQANAIPVAEFCVGQILLAAKGFFRNTRECRDPELRHEGPLFSGRGIYGAKVALIGAGAIAMKTKELLESYNLDVFVVPSRPSRRTVSLEEAFEQAYVVSNHLPNRDDNIGVLNGDLFRRMPYGATFINTGRGAQVNEDELIQVMKERPDLTALLDVTWPEPPNKDSELYTLPNVQLSSHIAGSLNDEVVRMADYAIAEFKRWEKGEELKYQISEDMLMTS